MKAIIHIPTVQFGYIEIELEDPTPEEIIVTKEKLEALIKNKQEEDF